MGGHEPTNPSRTPDGNTKEDTQVSKLNLNNQPDYDNGPDLGDQVVAYVRQWCENHGEDFDDVWDWLERTSYEDELLDLGYVEEVLDRYHEWQEESED